MTLEINFMRGDEYATSAQARSKASSIGSIKGEAGSIQLFRLDTFSLQDRDPLDCLTFPEITICEPLMAAIPTSWT